MLTAVRSRRAWIYVLSVLALLVPAGGIAYLGAVSYRDEKGAVSTQTERQRQAALAIAGRIDHAIEDSLDAIDRATIATGGAPSGPLTRYWFWIDADGRMRVPHAAPQATSDPAGALDRNGPCASGLLEDCVRELSTRQSRVAKLHAAQRAEACHGDACAQSWAEARRQYTQLVSFNDTGQFALLGLARVLARLGDAKGAEAELTELDHRFADRNFDGVPVRLVTAILRADKRDPQARLDIADAVVAGRYTLDPVVGVGVVGRLRAQLQGELPPDLAARRAALDERIAALRSDARAAQGLADDVSELLGTATPAWRGRQASHQAGRTLVYRRRPDGGIVGMSVDATMLEDAAGHERTDDVAQRARVLVLPAGASPTPELRTIAQVPLGEALPHLSLALVNSISDPDPLDEVIRERSRRHVVFTSALAIALGLGLLATIRGAARARELAQLKSDFVSTVSHELKTPLTSIRMFAEMLEQGVAQGDATKMHRYHGVIVKESQRLGLLIANLLDYAQIERGTRRYTSSRENIAELARHAVSTFEALSPGPEMQDASAGERNPIAVDVSSGAMKAEVDADRDVLVQAVLNLLANAAKYGGSDRIEVTVAADATTASISVRDHGPGIPPLEQARIFREFYRAPEAYRSGVEGTGLGLALVKRHIEALGGTVGVASQVGHGATFTIALPRVTEKV
ncbi:MAG: histidine kinase [Myxococcales bacterium]|nr:histidine kinase [Myxococcales bacterium]